MSSIQEIQEKITNILVHKLGIADTEVSLDANFTKDLGIDSLDYAELIIEFEQNFKIRIPDEDTQQMETIQDAIEYIQYKISNKKEV